MSVSVEIDISPVISKLVDLGGLEVAAALLVGLCWRFIGEVWVDVSRIRLVTHLWDEWHFDLSGCEKFPVDR